MRSSFVFFFLCVFIFSSCVGPRFTSNNYVYEGDFYKLHLNKEISSTESTIAQLQQELQVALQQDPNNVDLHQELEQKIEDANEKKASLNSSLGLIPELVGLEIAPPPPPCPDENNTCNIPADLKHLVFSSEVNLIGFLILQGNNTLYELDNMQPQEFPNSDGAFKFVTFDLNTFDGAVNIQVKRKKGDELEVEYLIDAIVAQNSN